MDETTTPSLGAKRTLGAAQGLAQGAGFSLMELVVVLAVISILAMLAYPSFLQQLRQARRADGQTALVRLAIAEERFRADCPHYASRIAGSRNCASGASALSTLGMSELSGDGYYRLAVASASALEYSLNAVAQGDQAHDQAAEQSCETLSIDQDGSRAPAECW